MKEPYVAKLVDNNGMIHYSKEENAVWNLLICRQIDILKERACPEYLEGLSLLNLPTNRVPQCTELSEIIKKQTGWVLEPVPSFIEPHDFFSLLANRKFPVTSFIRRREDLRYMNQPDIFHELMGHCPLLMHPVYADFVHAYGKLSLDASPSTQALLGKLFCFTIEVGLVKTAHGLRIYGGGILSSENESIYALESSIPQRKPFNLHDIILTPYSIAEVQPIYYVIDNFETLFDLLRINLVSTIEKLSSLTQPL